MKPERKKHFARMEVPFEGGWWNKWGLRALCREDRNPEFAIYRKEVTCKRCLALLEEWDRRLTEYAEEMRDRARKSQPIHYRKNMTGIHTWCGAFRNVTWHSQGENTSPFRNEVTCKKCLKLANDWLKGRGYLKDE